MHSKPRKDGWLFWSILFIVAMLCVALSQFRAQAQGEHFYTQPNLPNQQQLPPQDSGNLQPYTALVEIQMPGGNGQGTGTLVAKKGSTGLILSARHVAIAPGEIVGLNWISAGGQKTAGQTIKVMRGNGFASDMALIVGEVPASVQPAQVAKFDPANAPFYGAGYRDHILRVGGPYNSVFHGENGELIISEPWVHGMSGGAVYDKFGRLVGVVVASNGKNHAVASDGPNLQELLREYAEIR